jgi:hypothetical protein
MCWRKPFASALRRRVRAGRAIQVADQRGPDDEAVVADRVRRLLDPRQPVDEPRGDLAEEVVILAHAERAGE